MRVRDLGTWVPACLALLAGLAHQAGAEPGPTPQQRCQQLRRRRGTVQVLARGQASPWALAIAGQSIYWATRGPDGAAGHGAVLRADKDGGFISPVAIGQTNPCALTLDATHVYWASHGSSAAGLRDGGLYRAERRGGPAEKLLGDLRSPWGLAVVAGHGKGSLFFATQAGALGSWPLDGVPGETAARVRAAGQRLTGLAAAGHEVFYSDTAAGEVRRLLLTTGDSHVVAARLRSPAGVAVDRTHVYWAGFGDGSLARAPREGGPVQLLARGLRSPRAVALGPAHLYATDGAAGRVVRVPLGGGEVQTVSAGHRHPYALAVDRRAVYFTDLDAGTVLRVALPR